ncbi:hypothetical protein BLOT_008405 [Blomia tropicalis]|nr:hypothetical protein BLOT_008405 [Blomia tropicalis]
METSSTNDDELPYRVSSDFNLALFLRKEKSSTNISVPSNITFGKSESFASNTVTYTDRFKHVDHYVTHQYWSLDVEFIFSCICPIFWSITGLYLLWELLPCPCKEANRNLFISITVLFFVNIFEQVITITMLIYAKYSKNWYYKVYILNFTIGIKLFLTATNFIITVICFEKNSCGFWYLTQLNGFISSNEYEKEMDHKSTTGISHLPPAEIGGAIINGFRYYDTKIMGLAFIFSSVAHCVGSMLLLVKRNDIKIYVLWRLEKLDEYIGNLFKAK